ncbi:hypothetical protein PAHAL_8G187700 [Panicum hallii]|uniref:Uncharacterized protein n=1 Tax=Panicum hallii TaxID=206008 RepID=A0A2T8I9G3_9POAL|nr:hypothetical protein PAHAL_8G187700 [Panicum hallii]
MEAALLRISEAPAARRQEQALGARTTRATTRRPTAACGASSGVSSTEGSACSGGPRHAATWAPKSGASRGVSSRPVSAASGTRLMVSLPSLMARPSTASGSRLSTRRRPSWSVSERGVMSWSGC